MKDLFHEVYYYLAYFRYRALSSARSLFPFDITAAKAKHGRIFVTLPKVFRCNYLFFPNCF